MANNDQQVVPFFLKNPVLCPGFELNSDARKGSRLAAFCIRCYSHRTLHTRVATEVEASASPQLLLPQPPLPQPHLPMVKTNTRPRTKFTEAQKNRSRTFSANSGWKIRRQDHDTGIDVAAGNGSAGLADNTTEEDKESPEAPPRPVRMSRRPKYLDDYDTK